MSDVPEIKLEGVPSTTFRGETSNVVAGEDHEDGERVNQYVILKKLGEGAFGTVFHVLDSDSNASYAMKVIDKARVRRRNSVGTKTLGRRPPGAAPVEKKDPLDMIRREIAIMKKLNHKHVLKIVEVLNNEDTECLYMILELAHGGAVMSMDANAELEPLEHEYARHVFRQLVLGVEYLHFQDIAHRDLKPDNLLISSDGTVVLADFSVSEEYSNGADSIKKTAGSPAFMAPEMLVARSPGETFSAKRTDIWAMGVCLYCFLTGTTPFKAGTLYLTYEAIKNDDIVIPETVPAPVHDLILGMMNRSPDERMALPDIKNHSWVTHDGTRPLPSTEENCNGQKIEVTEEEIQRSIGSIKNMSNLMTVMRAVNRFKLPRRGSDARPFPEKE